MILPILCSLVTLNLNLADLKPLNDGRPVLVPGIAADRPFVSLSWDEAALRECVTNGVFASAGMIPYAKENDTPPEPGASLLLSGMDRIAALSGDELAEAFGGSVTNLASLALSLRPAEKDPTGSNYVFRAKLTYPGEAACRAAHGELRTLQEEVTWPEGVRPGTELLPPDVVFTLEADRDGLFRSFGAVFTRWMQRREEELGEASPCARSLAAGSDEKVFEIPPERRRAVKKAETDFLRRVLLDPVAAALGNESPERRKDWQGVLQTVEDALYCFGGGTLGVNREYVGRGAQAAYDRGCRYPTPIAYAFSSLMKRKDVIREAFTNAFEALGEDTRWNAHTRLNFYAYMDVGDNAPESYRPAVRAKVTEAMRDVLLNPDCSPDELGMVYQKLRASDKGELPEAYRQAKAAGAAIDPWLEAMLEGHLAYKRAWTARGEGYADTVSESGWKTYGEEIPKVLPLMEKAYHLRPELPQSCCLALRTAHGDGIAADLWLRRLEACRPDMLEGYSEHLFGLRPRWGGSTREMADFLLGLVRQRDFDTVVPVYAYEKLRRDVFGDEGGVRLPKGGRIGFDAFVRDRRGDLEPLFEGYRRSGFPDRACFIEKVHVYANLADLAWRLENPDELLYWQDRLEATGMPPRQVYNNRGYDVFRDRLPALRKLEGERRRAYLIGAHAVVTDGNPLAIDRMLEIAESLGEHRYALECRLSRKGTVDLKPFFSASESGFKTYDIDFTGRARDHMIFRFRLRGAEDANFARFRLQFIALPQHRWERADSDIDIQFARGSDWSDGVRCPLWPRSSETCAFELEISGARARLTQDGVRIWEKKISSVPSLSQLVRLSGFAGIATTVESMTLEIRDDAGFLLPSAYRAAEERPRGVERVLALDGVGPQLEVHGIGRQPREFLGNHLFFNGLDSLELDDDKRYAILGATLKEIGEAGATVVVDCGTLHRDLKGPEVILGGFGLAGKRNRVMVVADTASRAVYAVADGNAKRWEGKGKVDLLAAESQYAFSYSYARGLSAYQRVRGGEWTELVSSDRCRYRGEAPTQFTFGCYDGQGGAKLPFGFILGLPVKGLYVYPKAFSDKELGSFPQ